MTGRIRYQGAIMLLAVWGAASLGSYLSPVQSAAAAVVSPYVIKGFVTSRTGDSVMVLAGQTAVRVGVDGATRITGQRSQFDDVAVHDLVRVEGRLIEPDHLQAQEIEVVLAVGTLVAGRAASGTVSGFWSWLQHGGFSLSMP